MSFESEPTPDSLGRILLGEPVTRSDGDVVRLLLTKKGNLEVDMGGIGASYDRTEVLLVGGGDFDRGVLRIGQANLRLSGVETLAGKDRALNTEIERLRDLNPASDPVDEL
ncbi:MAG TPA: hypothetical protein VG604_00325 [Candidatus Saccharimonadales bacterium]|nr:hypothetical protein [Candidatus Saccharimonadales bacterium]